MHHLDKLYSRVYKPATPKRDGVFNMKKKHALILSFYAMALVALVIVVCVLSGRVGEVDPGKVDAGCVRPPPDVFKSVGIDVKFAQSTFKKLTLGEIDVKSDPKVLSLASQAMTDLRIQDYLKCLAIHRDKYTQEEAQYYYQLLGAFMSTRPSPDQFIEWQKKNPAPRREISLNPSEQAIYRLQDEIVALKGTYERMKAETNAEAQLLAARKVEEGAINLFHQMTTIDDSNLKLTYQIQKYEYATLAGYMAAYVVSDKQQMSRFSENAANCGAEALAKLEILSKKNTNGEKEAIKDFDWMVKDLAFDRIHDYRAIAMAINVCANGKFTRNDVSNEWYQVSDFYKKEYPASSNRYLSEVLGSGNQQVTKK
jgi:hypothetical protein